LIRASKIALGQSATMAGEERNPDFVLEQAYLAAKSRLCQS
jgi:hypothetical protein